MKWKDCLPKPKGGERMNPSRDELRFMDRENKKFPVDRLVEIPREEWPIRQPAKLIRVLRSRDFLVQVFAEPNDVLRLSIQRCAFDRKSGRWVDGIAWDDLQHLKTLAGYGERTAVELYPPDGDMVNVANLRHLWLVRDAPDFMWRRS
ncbi:DUF7694 domain-containing protein [Tsuneonella suprasediminis]|uniref:DUF7694 domain-containing protein n=1 Tax=Tsuneonella suprasediminis TaxID=2306996 RepID=UPI002F92C665